MYKKIVNKILNQQNTDVLHELMKKPHKETGDDMPHYQDFEKNYAQQADLLFLPSDKGYKYLLVIVDDSTRLIDAEPLKDKYTTSIVKAFQKIYSRNILSPPKHIEVDSGNEFKGTTEIYFKKLNIHIKVGDVNRHRQLGLVENANQRIGKIIFMIQNQKELETKKQSKQWISHLRSIIDELNEHVKNRIHNQPISDEPLFTKYNSHMLNRGDNVRVLLDYPIDIHNNKRLHGDFRSGDIRWSLKIYKITELLLRDGFPPMYLVDNGKTTQYTKAQLQVVHHQFV